VVDPRSLETRARAIEESMWLKAVVVDVARAVGAIDG
jgi:hypothetical protein